MLRLVQKLFVLSYLLSGCITQAAFAQDEVPEAPATKYSSPLSQEQYRIRVQNAELGRIDISMDRGSHWLLVGRVTKPMTAPGKDHEVRESGQIVKCPSTGIRISLGAAKAMTLLPGADKGTKKRTFTSGNIVTNLGLHAALFEGIKPLLGSKCFLLRNDSETEFSDTFMPQDDDSFLIKVSGRLETITKEAILLEAKDYFENALARAKAEKRTIVAGTLTLKIRISMGDVDPVKVVFYVIDGDTIAIQNASPFQFQWETDHLDDGEYLVEIRGQNAGGTIR